MAMLKRISFGLITLLVLGAWDRTGRVWGEEPKSGPPATLKQLSLEVSALHILHHLSATPAQLLQLRKLAKDAKSKESETKTGKGSDKFRTALLEMHQALLENKNAEQIDKLTEKLDALR